MFFAIFYLVLAVFLLFTGTNQENDTMFLTGMNVLVIAVIYRALDEIREKLDK